MMIAANKSQEAQKNNDENSINQEIQILKNTNQKLQEQALNLKKSLSEKERLLEDKIQHINNLLAT